MSRLRKARSRVASIADGPVGGGVISYEIAGKQYVATTSGVVSGFFGASGTSVIIIFSLP